LSSKRDKKSDEVPLSFKKTEDHVTTTQRSAQRNNEISESQEKHFVSQNTKDTQNIEDH